MRIYITGMAGFVGSNLANYLHEFGYDIYGCDDLSFGYSENINPEVYLSEKRFQEVSTINDHDVLVHCATSNIIYAGHHPIETYQNNAIDTIEMFEKFDGKIINLSTASVYGNAIRLPTPEDEPKQTGNAYSQSKLIVEQYLRARGNYTTLRLSNVYGMNQRPDHHYSGVIGKFFGAVLSGEPVKIFGDGLDTRDFTYVMDVVDVIEKAINTHALNTEINIGTGVENSVLKLAHDIHDIVDVPLKVSFVESRGIDGINRRCMDIDRAKELLNWHPETDLKLGLKKILPYYLHLD